MGGKRGVKDIPIITKHHKVARNSFRFSFVLLFFVLTWFSSSLTQSFDSDRGLLNVCILSPRRDWTIACTAFVLNILTNFSNSRSIASRFDIFGLTFTIVFAEFIIRVSINCKCFGGQITCDYSSCFFSVFLFFITVVVLAVNNFATFSTATARCRYTYQVFLLFSWLLS